jgi:antitoxin component of RelBE/YafQ-DinJ toxin-antitoxin module
MTTQIVFNIDPKVKTKAMQRAKREGIPFASVLKMATKAFADGTLSVEMVGNESFNAATRRQVEAALRDISKSKNLRSFGGRKEMDNYLKSI